MTLTRHLCLLSCALLLAAQSPADPPWPDILPAPPTAKLIAAQSPSNGKAPILFGIHIQLGETWKTYWRNPGASGLPPQFDWSQSVNLAKAEVLYPAPERIPFPGGDIFGYRRSVVFPIRATPKDPNKPIQLRLKLAYAVCDSICIPLQKTLASSIPAALTQNSKNAKLIKKWKNRVPHGRKHAADLQLLHTSLKENTIILSFAADKPLREPHLFLETSENLFFGTPKPLAAPKNRARFAVPVNPMPPHNLKISLLLRDSQRILQTTARLP